MRAIALIGAAPLPGQTVDCPGQILQIRDCPGDSGTVGAYAFEVSLWNVTLGETVDSMVIVIMQLLFSV